MVFKIWVSIEKSVFHVYAYVHFALFSLTDKAAVERRLSNLQGQAYYPQTYIAASW